ncbi:hypothetical protein BESB_016890 [Besnoitia besnoiti]|uniref:subtilisin n=1 Tax=Besnoitia besnoiti TaxID=94643 RepID=A0A2A9M7V6_BESBE|nr:hypothetical protein BESB_016890 [Besnoitia besnoiti]PFH32371.1 hypothetical protein BESB_016890 [Besnoitia besnoiti]
MTKAAFTARGQTLGGRATPGCCLSRLRRGFRAAGLRTHVFLLYFAIVLFSRDRSCAVELPSSDRPASTHGEADTAEGSRLLEAFDAQRRPSSGGESKIGAGPPKESLHSEGTRQAASGASRLLGETSQGTEDASRPEERQENFETPASTENATDTLNHNILILCGRSSCTKKALETATRDAMEQAANARFLSNSEALAADRGRSPEMFRRHPPHLADPPYGTGRRTPQTKLQELYVQGPDEEQQEPRESAEKEAWAAAFKKVPPVFRVSVFVGEELRKLADEEDQREATGSRRTVADTSETVLNSHGRLRTGAEEGEGDARAERKGRSSETAEEREGQGKKAQTPESAHLPQAPEQSEPTTEDSRGNRDGFLSSGHSPAFPWVDISRLFQSWPYTLFSRDSRPPFSASPSSFLPAAAPAPATDASEPHRYLQGARSAASSSSAAPHPHAKTAEAGTRQAGDAGDQSQPQAALQQKRRETQGRGFDGSAITQVRYVLWDKASGSEAAASASAFHGAGEDASHSGDGREAGKGQMRKQSESVCVVEGATLHHLLCEVVRLQDCSSVIDPQVFAAYLEQSPCVKAVGFDRQASPYVVEEETKLLRFPRPRSPTHAEGRRSPEEPVAGRGSAPQPAEVSASANLSGSAPTLASVRPDEAHPDAGDSKTSIDLILPFMGFVDSSAKERQRGQARGGSTKTVEGTEGDPGTPDGDDAKQAGQLGERDSRRRIDPWSRLLDRFKSLPNDPLFSWIPQWELLNEAAGVDANAAWRRTKGGSGTIEEQPANTVALVDFGFELRHEDLWHQWWRNSQVGAKTGTAEWPDNCEDGIDNDENGYVDDCFGFSFADAGGSQQSLAGKHGTAVASQCCAGTNNARGIAAVGWNLRPMALRVDGSYSQIAEAVNYAADKGVKVINLSLGGPASPVLRHVVEAADKRNITLVVAAGNHRCDLAHIEQRGCQAEDGSEKGYPASYSDSFLNIISVGATDKDGNIAPFSNFDSSPSHSRVQVMAPGREVPSCSDRKRGADEYLAVSGTSFSSPIVAGIVGLVQLERPDLSPHTIRALIVNSCKGVPNTALPSVCQCGGLVSAERALRLAGVGRKREPRDLDSPAGQTPGGKRERRGNPDQPRGASQATEEGGRYADKL